MSLRLRVLVLGLLFGAVLGVAGLLILDTLGDESESRTVVRERVQPADDAARLLLAGLIDQETGTRGYVITGDEAFLEPYFRGQRQAASAMARIEEVAGDDPAIAAELRRVRILAERWRDGGPGPEIAARRAGNAGLAQRIVASGAGRLRFDRVRESVDRLQALIEDGVTAANADANGNAEQLRRELAVVALLLLVLVLITLVVLRRWMLAPLRALRLSLRSVAAGDLTRPIEPTGPPETRSLAEDAEAMRRRILDELEASEGAREALEQQGPVVVGLREQLDATDVAAPPGIRSAAVLHPAEGILAGDWYDVLALPSGTAALLVVDVSGHGAQAGLIAVRLKHVLSTALRLGRDPGQALALAAEDFSRERDRFATCVIVELDPASGRARWANAGHPPPLVATQGRVLAELGTTGPLLSSMGGAWTVSERVLLPGELLLAYTDGLTEARDEADELGDERVRETLAGLDELTPAAAVDACLAAARAHARERRRDDITIVALQLEGSGVTTAAS